MAILYIASAGNMKVNTLPTTDQSINYKLPVENLYDIVIDTDDPPASQW